MQEQPLLQWRTLRGGPIRIVVSEDQSSLTLIRVFLRAKCMFFVYFGHLQESHVGCKENYLSLDHSSFLSRESPL